MYRVIKHFVDLHDNDHSYEEGDIFPREGVTVLKERIAELAGSDNKQHTPLIELVEEASDENSEEANVPDEQHGSGAAEAPTEQSVNVPDTSAENSEEKAPASKAKKTRSKKAEEAPAE